MAESRLDLAEKIIFVFGIILGLLVLYFITSSKNIDIKFDEFALGDDTISHFGKIEKKHIHCQDESDIHLCLNSYYQFGKNMPITIWLGNSQLNGINQFQKGQETAPQKLHKLALKNNQYLISVSQPNANLQEHFLLTSFLNNKLDVKNIILSVVLDDTRENGLRDSLRYILSKNNIKGLIEEYETGKNLIIKHDKKEKRNNFFKESKNESLQDKSEKFLNEKFKNNWTLWSERENLRGALFISLYKLRNFIFRITPSTTRNILPGQYQKNFEALNDIIKLTKKNKINLIIYNVPIRNDFKIPYNINDYKNFKNSLLNLSKKKQFNYYNLENIVPNSFWGEKTPTTMSKKKEIDFMHFKEEGHKILSKKIYSIMINHWNN